MLADAKYGFYFEVTIIPVNSYTLYDRRIDFREIKQI